MSATQRTAVFIFVCFLNVSLLQGQTQPADNRAASSGEVMFYSDGRHSSVYLYEPPMGVRQYVEPIDELLDLGVDTITYAVGDCSVLLYETKVGERWGHNLDLVNHVIWYRAGQNSRSLIERGKDPLRVVCDHAHKRGFKFLPHLLLNMLHTPPNRVTNSRVADFTTQHPEWQVGPEPDYPESVRDQPNRLSYSRPEVRANRLAVIRELVESYPTDGIEINFHDYVPLIARREVSSHTQTITEWVREIRAVCDRAAASQGREKRFVIRIGGSLDGSKALGMDLETWIQEKLVDAVIAMPVTHGFEGSTSELRKVIRTATEAGIPVMAGLNNHTSGSGSAGNTRDVYYAAAVNAYAAGAAGVLFQTYYPGNTRYPYDDAATGTVRFMGHPDVLVHKDKRFRLSSKPKPDTVPRDGISWQLPVVLEPGENGPEIHLEVSDDVAAKAEAGELWNCELRIMLSNMMHADKVRLWWNGAEIPPEQQRMADWTYQLRKTPTFQRSSGYRLHVKLKGEQLPGVGDNLLRVDVLQKDSRLTHSIRMDDVELKVEYLSHRNGLRPDER